MAWTFYNSSGEALINDGGVQAGSAVFTGNVDLGSNLLVGNAGSTGIAVSANGEVTMAAQPAFLFYNAASVANVTGDATDYAAVFATELIDQTDDYASNIFTCPISGRYRFSVSVTFTGIASGHTRGRLRLVTTDYTYEAYWNPYNETASTDGNSFVSLSVLADMDITDTARVTTLIGGGAKACDFGGTGELITSFCGELVV
jgi:hypothetical protein